jgi:hypothetical protein
MNERKVIWENSPPPLSTNQSKIAEGGVVSWSLRSTSCCLGLERKKREREERESRGVEVRKCNLTTQQMQYKNAKNCKKKSAKICKKKCNSQINSFINPSCCIKKKKKKKGSGAFGAGMEKP